MPILTVEGKCYAAWNNIAQRKLKVYSLSQCLSGLQLAHSNLSVKSNRNNSQLELHTQHQPSAAPDAALELRKNITTKQATAVGPVGGFNILVKHWESYLKDLKPMKSNKKVVQFTSLFSHVSRYSHDDTMSFIGACIHGLLSGYTTVISGLYDEKMLTKSLAILLRSVALNDLSRLSLSISETEARSKKFWGKLEQIDINLTTFDNSIHINRHFTTVDNCTKQVDSAYDPNIDTTVIGHKGTSTLQVTKLLKDQGLADTGFVEEYRFTTTNELNKKNHQPPVVFSINLSTNIALVSSIIDFFTTLFRTKYYQRELTERLHLIKQANSMSMLPYTGHSALQNIWQYLHALVIEFISQYTHLNNLKVSDLLREQSHPFNVQGNEIKAFELLQISRLIEFLPSILSKNITDDQIDNLLTVLPCVKLPRYVHVQLDCSELSMQTITTNSRPTNLSLLLTFLLAIPQVTVSVKQTSLNRIRILSSSDHNRFHIKYIWHLALSPTSDADNNAISAINEKANSAILSINERALVQKALKESVANNELQNDHLLQALEIRDNSSKSVTDRNIAQVRIILKHLNAKSKARIALRHLLELQERKMRNNGHNLKSIELAKDSDSVSVDELKESLLDTEQNKSAIILAGQTLESILSVFIDTESVLDGGIKQSNTTKPRLESPLKRIQDCDTVGLYIVCTYTGIITLLNSIDGQN